MCNLEMQTDIPVYIVKMKLAAEIYDKLLNINKHIILLRHFDKI